MIKRALGHRKLLIGVIIVCLIAAIIAYYVAFSVIRSDKPAQSVDTSTILIQQDTPAGTQFSLPISSRITLQATLQANTQPKTTTALQPSAAPQSVPTPTPMPAKLTVIITNLGSFQCAQVLFKGLRLGNTVTANDLQNHQNTITGVVTGAGMFSVDFYSTNNCSGTRGNYIRDATTTNATYTCDGSKGTNLCTKQN